MKLKNILILLVFTMIIFTAYGSILDFSETEPPKILEPAQGQVTFLDRPLSLANPLYYVTGRLYLPLADTIHAINGYFLQTEEEYRISYHNVSLSLAYEEDEKLIFPLEDIQDIAYISLTDLTGLLRLSAVFESEKSLLHLYHRRELAPVPGPLSEPKPAYLRLEDIFAEGGNGNFSHVNLEKIRAMADYLSAREQHFSVAWVPLYTNPPAGIQNDLTKDYNFYNADFLYTLDYLRSHNGTIGIHGLTHQERDTVSGIGVEFGPDTPFSEEEIRERMLRAKEIFSQLGFRRPFFEFPHTIATPKQLQIAEEYFDLIYQQDSGAKKYGIITQKEIGIRTVTYLPTPTGYISTEQEFPGVMHKLDQTEAAGEVASLFFHPYLDYQYIKISTVDGVRQVDYSENGMLPRLLKHVENSGYSFSSPAGLN